MDEQFESFINEDSDRPARKPSPVALVLNPYVRRPATLRVLHPQPQNVEYMYRVLIRTTEEDGEFKYSDVVDKRTLIRENEPGPKKTSRLEQYVLLFSEGAEFELERYLRYLDTTRLVNKNGEPPVICVGRQPTFEAINEVYLHAPWNKTLLRNTKIHFISSSESLESFLWVSQTPVAANAVPAYRVVDKPLMFFY